MDALTWIVVSGLLMSAIALVGAATLLLSERALERAVRPLVAFAAGSLVGGALLHMIPEAVQAGAGFAAYGWTLVGFSVFLGLEQLLHWHHCQRASAECRQPLTYLILVGDALHNLLGGLAVGAAFVADIRLGITTWLAAAAHEVPQELGDFGVLIHGGWSRGQALLFNFLSALTFPLGGLLAYGIALRVDTTGLLAFAAGNFLYIGASDLVPEVNKHRELPTNLLHFGAFVAGAAILGIVRLLR
jgi:zinc and cadmium transporter